MLRRPDETTAATQTIWVHGRELRSERMRELLASVMSARVVFIPESAWSDPERSGEAPSVLVASPRDLPLDEAGKALLRRWTRRVAVVALEECQRAEVALDVIEAGVHDYLGLDKTDPDELAMRLRLAAHRFEREAELRRESLTDELTKLLNRRGFLAHAQERLAAALRDQRQLLLLYADVDDMKSINDQRGHHAGDRALMSVARALRLTFRANDVLGRLSGDEFAVLAEGATLRDVRKIERRLRAHLAGVSLSLGAATFDPGSPSSLQELLGRADAAMYAMKHRHRFRLR
ncbi:MAG: GGDEF domain-containing protein [Fimbriimonadaceae bacterium]|nr:GGDEF domain-containing protein [Fimbriimonadaceae bacterium]